MYNEVSQKLTQYGTFDDGKDLLDFIEEIGSERRNIVYSNSKDSVIEYNVSIENKTDWLQMANFHADWTKKFYDVIVPYIQQMN